MGPAPAFPAAGYWMKPWWNQNYWGYNLDVVLFIEHFSFITSDLNILYMS